MDCVAIDYGKASVNDFRPAIQRASALLERVLSTSGDEIRSLTTQFQGLASEVESILELTSVTVDCVRGEWVQSIVPTVRRLGEAARGFLEQRNQSLSAVGVVFGNEANMLESLSVLATQQRSIAREAKALAVLANIEVSRLGAPGSRFEYMARELNEFSTMVSSGAEVVRDHAQQRRASLLGRRRKLHATLQQRKEHFTIIRSELGEAIATMTSELADLARIPRDFQACVAIISDNISRVVEAVQMQDVTRQQTEHVRDVLREAVGGDAAAETAVECNLALNAALLRVQARQVQSARTNMEQWVRQVNGCLESILCAGSSEVVALGARILEQQRGLSVQLSRIERLVGECEADDADIELCLAGVGALMRTARTHLERSMQTRDQMQLLNFNSMIEARHLGSRATVILEITRNIGRISTGWTTLTNRSGAALDDILHSSAQAEQAHRTMTRVGIEDVEKARQESHMGLVALTNAATIAESSGGKIERGVAELHDRIAIVRCIADGLTQSVAVMQEAGEEIEMAEEICGNRARALTEADRQQIEDRCAASYTSELERRVLRSTLRGEALPPAGATVTGNDVELF